MTYVPLVTPTYWLIMYYSERSLLSYITWFTAIPMKSDKGFALIENILALGLLGIIAAIFLGGVGTGANANRVAGEQVTAECLARSEIEYIKSCAYQYDTTEYSVDQAIEIPNGWSIPNPAVEALHTPDNGIQKVTIVIRRNGLEELSTIVYKVDR